MYKIFVNNNLVFVKKNSTVLQACEKLNIKLPRFCFHKRLLIAGNCRLCLVEIEKIPKPIAACAIPVAQNIKIYTNTPVAKKARENILEFLLVNHPLDCPICDQAGECDLQNQSQTVGKSFSRSLVTQKSSSFKFFSIFIKSFITRCIQCSRCTRFFSEKLGSNFFSMLSRGKSIEVNNYTQTKSKHKLSGNVIDLCPVGFFSKKYFKNKKCCLLSKLFFLLFAC